MVVGLLPRLRYVVLTDRLLIDLTPDEIEAVFGHEVGHVKHHHMLYYFSFLSISLMVLVGVWQLLDPLLAPHFSILRSQGAEWTWPMVIGSLVVYIFVVFGFLSRRCERQADIFGCRAVSCGQPDCQGHEEQAIDKSHGQWLCPTGIRTFIQALEKVAILNGISRNRPGWLQSWQHSTIAARVDFLQRMLVDSSIEPHFQRRVFLVKCVLMVCLIALLGIVSWTLGQRPDPPGQTPARVAQLGE
jgi:STE24 endopeptidase